MRAFPAKILNDKKITHKLTFKLSFIYLLIAIITIVVIGTLVYGLFKEYLTMQFQNDVLGIIGNVKNNIEERIKFYNLTMNTLFVNSDLNAYLAAEPLSKDYKGQDPYTSFVKTLEDIQADNNTIDYIRIYTDNRNVAQDNRYFFDERSISSLSWYKEMMNKGNPQIPYTPKDDKGHILFIRVINNAKNFSYSDKIGLLVMYVKTEAVFSGIDSYFLNKVNYFFVEDIDGNIIYSNRTDLIGSKVPVGIKLTSTGNSTNTDNVFIQHDKDTVYFFSSLVSGKWMLSCISGISQLSQGSGYIANWTVAACLLGIGMFCFFTILLTRRLYYRLTILNCQIKKLGEGEFSHGNVNDGLDEIGILSLEVSRITKQLNDLVEEHKRCLLKEKEISFKFLQNQIKPYFLYNTLSVINWMAIRSKLYSLSEMTVSLSEFYRHSLQIGKNLITVSDEISLLKSYVKLQELAYPGLFKAVFIIDDIVNELYTVRLILQPIIENAIIHGILPKGTFGTVVTRCHIEDGNAVFDIIDDGIGYNSLDVDKKEGLKGIGLEIINERIKIFFGSKYGIKVFSKPGMGTMVTVKIPSTDKETAEKLESNFNTFQFDYRKKTEIY